MVSIEVTKCGIQMKYKEMYFATSNIDKFLEAEDYLDCPITRIDPTVHEIQSEDHFEVIYAKAVEARKRVTATFFIEDMAFYIDGLKGRPGTLVKFFVGPLGGGAPVYDMIYKLNPKNMGAFESTAIAYFHEEAKEPVIFINTVRGELIKPAGTRAFGFDRIFRAEGTNKTYAEMTIKEKNQVSSRGKSLKELNYYLNNKELEKTVCGTI
jgi:XTP/dITP diphosphohydrolase